MTKELLILAICAAVVCLILGLRSFIFKRSVRPTVYQVWIMTFGDDDSGNGPDALDDWPSEIEVPANFFTDAQAEGARRHDSRRSESRFEQRRWQ